MDLQLSDRVVLVVGGHGYLGRAVMRRLREEGAAAIPASRHAPEGIVIDGADDESVTAGVAALLAEHGRIDGLVVTAAPSAGTLDRARSADPKQVLSAIDGKAMTFLRLANAVIPTMTAQGYGRIVGVSGQNAWLTGSIAASTRNAVLNVAAKNLADALAGTGVTVNTVNPGNVNDTPAADAAVGAGGASSPDDAAALIAFLLSPLARAISGEAIAVGHRVRGVTGL